MSMTNGFTAVVEWDNEWYTPTAPRFPGRAATT
jgi:hypothetical protein